MRANSQIRDEPAAGLSARCLVGRRLLTSVCGTVTTLTEPNDENPPEISWRLLHGAYYVPPPLTFVTTVQSELDDGDSPQALFQSSFPAEFRPLHHPDGAYVAL